MAEPVMLALGSSIGRQEAHDIVYDAAQAAALGQRGFADLLAADQRISAKLSKNDIKNLLNPLSYVGLSPELARRAASSARDTAAELLN